MDNNAIALFSGSVIPESSVSKPKRRRKMIRKAGIETSATLDTTQYKVLGNFGEVECKKRRSQQYGEGAVKNFNHDYGFGGGGDISTSFQADGLPSKNRFTDTVQPATNSPAGWTESQGMHHSTNNGYEFSNFMFNTGKTNQNYSSQNEAVMFDALMLDQTENRSNFQCQQSNIKNLPSNVSGTVANTEDKQKNNEVTQLDSFSLILKDLMESASPFEPENSGLSVQLGDSSPERNLAARTTSSVPLVPLQSSTPNPVTLAPSQHHAVSRGPSRADASLETGQKDLLIVTSYQNFHVPLTSAPQGMVSVTPAQANSVPTMSSRVQSMPLKDSRGLVPVTYKQLEQLRPSSQGHSLPATTVQCLTPLQPSLNNSSPQFTPHGHTIPETLALGSTTNKIYHPATSALPKTMIQKPAQMAPANVNSVPSISTSALPITQTISQHQQQRTERFLQMLKQKQAMKRLLENRANMSQPQNVLEASQVLQNGHSSAQSRTVHSPSSSSTSTLNRPTQQRSMGWSQSASPQIHNRPSFDQGLQNEYPAAQSMTLTVSSQRPPSSGNLVSSSPRPTQNGQSADQGLQNVYSAALPVSSQRPPSNGNLVSSSPRHTQNDPSADQGPQNVYSAALPVSSQSPPSRGSRASTSPRPTHQPNSRNLHLESEQYFNVGLDFSYNEGSFIDQLKTPASTPILLDTNNPAPTNYNSVYNTSTQVDYLTGTTYSQGQSGYTTTQPSSYLPAYTGQTYVTGQPTYWPLSNANSTTAGIVSTSATTSYLTASGFINTQTTTVSPCSFSALSAPRTDSTSSNMTLTNQTSSAMSSSQEDDDDDALSSNNDSFYLNSLPSICFA